MHVSKEFLMEAVGLSLLVALILLSVRIFHRAEKLTGMLEEGQEQQIAWMEEYDIVKYDGMLVDGMTAVSYIKTLTGSYGIPVKVTTEKKQFTVQQKEEHAGLRDVESEMYINPLAKYKCTVVRNENEAIIEVIITVDVKGE